MGLPSISTMFNFKGSIAEVGNELQEIFPFAMKQDRFVQVDVVSIYLKILTDVVERTHGLDEDQAALLFDNCLMSTKGDGILSLLAKAMSDKKDLFIVYNASLGVVKEADGAQTSLIRAGYLTTAEKVQLGDGWIGVFVSFRNYTRTDMVRLYSSLEHATIGSLYKKMNLSKAAQLKMNELRTSTGLNSSDNVVAQAKQIAKGLSEGKDVLLDKNDDIVSATPELDSTKAAIDFIDAKRSFYLGLPASYINGAQTSGMNATGEADAKAVERGLKSYFFSIVKPVLEELFEGNLKYKSQDFRQITPALEALKTFDLVSERFISAEQKKIVIESLLDIDSDDNETDLEEEEPTVPPTNTPPPQNQPPGDET